MLRKSFNFQKGELKFLIIFAPHFFLLFFELQASFFSAAGPIICIFAPQAKFLTFFWAAGKIFSIFLPRSQDFLAFFAPQARFF